MAQYADRSMDFAGATLVHVAARERLRLILAVDHNDFGAHRRPGRKKFANPPAPDEKLASTATMMAEEPERSAPSKP